MHPLVSRRVAQARLLGLLVAARAPARPSSALVRFDQQPLRNRYILVRAGETASDAKGVINSNPINRADVEMGGLTARGRRQVVAAARAIQARGVRAPVIWFSTAASSTQTALAISDEFRLPRYSPVPEYNFLDARGLGALDGGPVAALADVHAADARDEGSRPPASDDGTPDESVGDVISRARQMLSITETQNMGQDVIIVAPDSDVLSLIAASMCGVPLGEHAARFAMAPGDVRDLSQLADTSTWRARRSQPTCAAPPAEPPDAPPPD